MSERVIEVGSNSCLNPLEVREKLNRFDWKQFNSAQLAVHERLGRRPAPQSQFFSGTTGCVYAAEIDGCPVALKAMWNYGDDARYSVLRTRFGSDYRVLESLKDDNHDHIAKVYHHFQARIDAFSKPLPDYNFQPDIMRPETMFVVMERMHTSLYDYVQQARSCPDETCDMMLLSCIRGLLLALDYLQEKKIAHCDLKYDNVMVALDGRVVLIDFGHSKDFRLMPVPFQLSLSSGFEKGGASYYIAPEIYYGDCETGEVVNYSKNDMFALGCLIYEMYGNTALFPGDGRPRSYNVEDLPKLKASRSAKKILNSLVRKLLQCNPAKRFSPKQALAYLDEQMQVFRRCILCMGSGGLGKSTLANKLVSDYRGLTFATSNLLDAATTEVRWHQGASELVAIDTPPLDDADNQSSQVMTMITNTLKDLARQGLRPSCVLLFLQPARGIRRDARIDAQVKLIHDCFGAEIWNHVVIVLPQYVGLPAEAARVIRESIARVAQASTIACFHMYASALAGEVQMAVRRALPSSTFRLNWELDVADNSAEGFARRWSDWLSCLRDVALCEWKDTPAMLSLLARDDVTRALVRRYNSYEATVSEDSAPARVPICQRKVSRKSLIAEWWLSIEARIYAYRCRLMCEECTKGHICTARKQTKICESLYRRSFHPFFLNRYAYLSYSGREVSYAKSRPCIHEGFSRDARRDALIFASRSKCVTLFRLIRHCAAVFEDERLLHSVAVPMVPQASDLPAPLSDADAKLKLTCMLLQRGASESLDDCTGFATARDLFDMKESIGFIHSALLRVRNRERRKQSDKKRDPRTSNATSYQSVGRHGTSSFGTASRYEYWNRDYNPGPGSYAYRDNPVRAHIFARETRFLEPQRLYASAQCMVPAPLLVSVLPSLRPPVMYSREPIAVVSNVSAETHDGDICNFDASIELNDGTVQQPTLTDSSDFPVWDFELAPLQEPPLDTGPSTAVTPEAISPLVQACYDQDLVAIAKRMATVQSAAGVNRLDASGSTLLHVALADDPSALSLLLKCEQIDVNRRNAWGQTPLHVAAYRGLYACVGALLAHPDICIDAVTTGVATALALALRHRRLSVALLLAERGATFTSQCAAEINSWRLSVGESLKADKVRVDDALRLIEGGLSMDDNGLANALHLAITVNCASPLHSVCTDAVMNAPDAYGRTPLMLALRYRRWETVSFLLERGCSVDVKDQSGRAALHFALESRAPIAFVSQLITTTSVAAVSLSLDTPLSIACASGNTEAVEALLRFSAAHVDFPYSGVLPTRPVHFRAKRTSVSYYSFERERSRRGNCPHCDPAIIVAARRGHWSIVNALLDHGANASLPGTDGSRLLDLALLSSQTQLVGRLIAVCDRAELWTEIPHLVDGRFEDVPRLAFVAAYTPDLFTISDQDESKKLKSLLRTLMNWLCVPSPCTAAIQRSVLQLMLLSGKVSLKRAFSFLLYPKINVLALQAIERAGLLDAFRQAFRKLFCEVFPREHEGLSDYARYFDAFESNLDASTNLESLRAVLTAINAPRGALKFRVRGNSVFIAKHPELLDALLVECLNFGATLGYKTIRTMVELRCTKALPIFLRFYHYCVTPHTVAKHCAASFIEACSADATIIACLQWSVPSAALSIAVSKEQVAALLAMNISRVGSKSRDAVPVGRVLTILGHSDIQLAHLTSVFGIHAELLDSYFAGDVELTVRKTPLPAIVRRSSLAPFLRAFRPRGDADDKQVLQHAAHLAVLVCCLQDTAVRQHAWFDAIWTDIVDRVVRRGLSVCFQLLLQCSWSVASLPQLCVKYGQASLLRLCDISAEVAAALVPSAAMHSDCLQLLLERMPSFERIRCCSHLSHKPADDDNATTGSKKKAKRLPEMFPRASSGGLAHILNAMPSLDDLDYEIAEQLHLDGIHPLFDLHPDANSQRCSALALLLDECCRKRWWDCASCVLEHLRVSSMSGIDGSLAFRWALVGKNSDMALRIANAGMLPNERHLQAACVAAILQCKTVVYHFLKRFVCWPQFDSKDVPLRHLYALTSYLLLDVAHAKKAIEMLERHCAARHAAVNMEDIARRGYLKLVKHLLKLRTAPVDCVEGRISLAHCACWWRDYELLSLSLAAAPRQMIEHDPDLAQVGTLLDIARGKLWVDGAKLLLATGIRDSCDLDLDVSVALSMFGVTWPRSLVNSDVSAVEALCSQCTFLSEYDCLSAVDHYVCRYADAQPILRLVEACKASELVYRDVGALTAYTLRIAIKCGREDIACKLLEVAPEMAEYVPTPVNWNCYELCYQAIQQDMPLLLRDIVTRHQSVAHELGSSSGCSLLHEALALGRSACYDALLHAGCDQEAPSRFCTVVNGELAIVGDWLLPSSKRFLRVVKMSIPGYCSSGISAKSNAYMGRPVVASEWNNEFSDWNAQPLSPVPSAWPSWCWFPRRQGWWKRKTASC